MNVQSITLRESVEDAAGRKSSRELEGGAQEIISEKGALVLKCYSRQDELVGLKSEWQQLEHASIEGFDYFQSYDWCMSWCQEFVFSRSSSSDAIPQIYALYKNSELVMIWPLMKVKLRSGLTFLETLTEPMGQYSNVLLNPDQVDAGIGQWVWDNVKSINDVDAIALNHFPSKGALADIIGDEGDEESVKSVSPILDFSKIESWESYSASLGKSQRKERNRKRRKLEAKGELSFDVHFSDSDNFSELVEFSIALKQKWLRSTNRHSQTLFEEKSEIFLRKLGQHGASNGDLEGPIVQVLSVDGQAIATEIGMLRQGHYYSYLGAIDLEWYDFSPGKIQIEMSQKWAFEHGVKKFDFLSDPSDYKQSWTNMIVEMNTRYVPISLKGRLYCSIWKARLKPFLRNLYRKSSPEFRKQVNRLLGLQG